MDAITEHGIQKVDQSCFEVKNLLLTFHFFYK